MFFSLNIIILFFSLKNLYIKMAREEKKFPAELYLDILKWLNFDQLIKIKPSTCYLKVFINDYKLKLARKKFREIYVISSTSEFKKLPKPKANFYDFQLSKELEKKWKHGIEESIPVFLNAYNEKDFPICFVEDYRDSTTDMHFPIVPKNIEEMKIARFLFEQLFTSAFEYALFRGYNMFNPQIIKLLFNENPTEIPLQIYSKEVFIVVEAEYYLNFIFNHLICNDLTIVICYYNDTEEYINDLLKISTDGGDKFSYVGYESPNLKLINLILEHVEKSKDLSKMVKEIRLSEFDLNVVMSKRAKYIKTEVWDDNIEYAEYHLSNEFNPKIEFAIFYAKYSAIEIERIN
uniref:Uncharacterized protein n=1 Tax=Meloidogyne enterolobii TaxID=390850 RepID=A0A6V7XQ40_MELEN|nr:unnamed protein product [Meloidogyne enterolobii]